MKKTILISIILVGLLAGCNSKPTKTTQTNIDSGGIISTSQSDNATAKNETVTSVTTPAETEVTKPPEKVGDGIFLIERYKGMPDVEINCTYGRAYPSDKITAYGATIDFSVLEDESEESYISDISYCILPDLTVFYATDYNLYKSDITLTNRELLLEMDINRTDLPSTINTIIKFDNSELLFFSGFVATNTNERDFCFGSINPDTGEVDFKSVDSDGSLTSFACNTGVMLCDFSTIGNARGKAWYWENGKISEVVMKNKNETEYRVYVSPNGKYICSLMQGQSQNGKLVERYSVYDIATGELIKSFDWTFEGVKWGDGMRGFAFFEINENSKSVYVYHERESKLYQLYFGE